MDVIMPQLGETVVEGVVAKWYKRVGDSVSADETLFDVETDKVNTEIPAPVSGVIAEILVEEGVTAKVGARLAVIRESGTVTSETAVQTAIVSAATEPQAAATGRSARLGRAAANQRLSPVVRRLIAEHRLDSLTIQGTGRDGRVTRKDVLAIIGARDPLSAPAGNTTRKPLNPVRKRTAEHMVKSWTTVPHVLQAVEVDFVQVEQAREGYTLTYLPFVARAVAIALAQFPLLNASIDGNDLVLHPRINLGIAVDLSFNGLVVPVVKDAANKSLLQLAREIKGLAQRARSNKLKPDEMTEGTYTLSNSGVFGTLITAPIINQPQVAILSIDGVHKKPVVVEGADGDSIVIRPVGVLVQTFDHRAVDGSYSAAFLREVKKILETHDWALALSMPPSM